MKLKVSNKKLESNKKLPGVVWWTSIPNLKWIKLPCNHHKKFMPQMPTKWPTSFVKSIKRLTFSHTNTHFFLTKNPQNISSMTRIIGTCLFAQQWQLYICFRYPHRQYSTVYVCGTRVSLEFCRHFNVFRELISIKSI